MECPHGKSLTECEVCWSQLKRFHEAWEAGDWRKTEQLSAEMRRDHERSRPDAATHGQND